ncbi:hypothetical protein FQZ97_1221470 [compost metagenome]
MTLRHDATLLLNAERADDYSVTNAAGDSITVAGFTSTQVRISAGGALEYVMPLDNGLNLTPQVRASLGLSGSDAARLNTTTFGTLGVGFSLSGTGDWRLGGNVDFGRDSVGLQSTAAKANLAVRF